MLRTKSLRTATLKVKKHPIFNQSSQTTLAPSLTYNDSFMLYYILMYKSVRFCVIYPVCYTDTEHRVWHQYIPFDLILFHTILIVAL